MNLEPLNDLAFLRETGEAARRLGFELYAVGGCVRDWLLGVTSADIDFLCGADPKALVSELTVKPGGVSSVADSAIGPRQARVTPPPASGPAVPASAKQLGGSASGGKVGQAGGGVTTFERFLTTRLFLADGRRLDFAVFRKESYLKPAALPSVSRAVSAAEDLKRRDFACNALAVSLLPGPGFGELLDPCGGADDIKKGVLRVLHERSFVDDPTRLYRAARFAGRFGWKLETKTYRLAIEAVKTEMPSLLSRERLRNELLKLLSEKDPLPAFELLKELDALKFLHEKFVFGPEVSAASGLAARLSILARLMGGAGRDFVGSLKLTRAMTKEIERGS
ncbi:MAG TPA: hypothetical protein DCG50_08165 [Elusimicrobia bacterium]|nr:hypothetical protein [Elusimicrobiota bacterium]